MNRVPLICFHVASVVAASNPSNGAHVDISSKLMALQSKQPTWLLLVPTSNRTALESVSSPQLLENLAGRDLVGMDAPDGDFKSFLQALGTPEDSRWVLLDPNGKSCASGNGFASPGLLRETMRRDGWVSKGDRLEKFLREHPENGEAVAEALEYWVRIEYHRLGFAATHQTLTEPWSTGDLPQKEIATALDRLVAIPEWTTSTRADLALALLGEIAGGEAKTAERPVESSARKAIHDVAARLQVEPHKARLWRAWASIALWVPESSPIALLQSLTPSPLLVWPPTPHASVLQVLKSRSDWQALDRFALEGWSAYSSGDLIDESIWKESRKNRVSFWGISRLEALLHQQRFAEATAWIETLHRESGSFWPSIAPMVSGIIKEVDPAFLTSEVESTLVGQPFLDPPSPMKDRGVDPLILSVRGVPLGDLDSFRLSEAFDPWDSTELKWEGGQQSLEIQGPTWALHRGADSLASGSLAETSPAKLASICLTFGEPRLSQFSRFLMKSPEALEVRLGRVQLLKSRVPHPRLTAILLEDMVTLRITPEFEGHPLEPELCSAAARKVLPSIEQRLAHFPSESNSWRAWLGWAQLHPKHPSISAFSDSLTIWGRREKWIQGLPEEVVLAIARDLESQHRWLELRALIQARLSADTGGDPSFLEKANPHAMNAFIGLLNETKAH